MEQPPPQAEIVIVAPRLPAPARDETLSVVRIDPNAAAAAPRIDEALSASPSASLFRRSSSLAANATIQGASLRAIAPSGAGRALVTLEGAPLNDPFGGWVIWSAIPPESIDAISIVRGAGAGAYGAGALTGVIALEEAPGPQRVRAALVAGERGYARGALLAGAQGFSFSASGETYDGATPVRVGAGAADTPAYFESGAASIRWTGSLSSAQASARLGLYREQRGAGLLGAASSSEGAHLSFTLAAPRTAGGWRAQVWFAASDFTNTSVAVAADRSAATPANDQFATPAFGAGANAAYRLHAYEIDWEFGADVRYAEGESRELFRNLGAGYTRDRAAGGETAIGGVYVEAAHARGPWLVTGGLRLDHSAAFNGLRRERDLASGAITLFDTPSGASETLPSARIAARRTLGADLSLRGAAYSGFRPPTLNELHRPFRVGNDVTEANAALQAERLYGAELGLSGAAWSATVFYNHLDDAIGSVTIGAGPGTFARVGFLPAGAVLRQRENLGRIEAFGVEAETSWRLGADLDLRFAIAATDAEVTAAPGAPQLVRLQPAQAPRAAATFGAVWRATPQLTLHADARWESARWEDDLNSRRLSAALSVDARASVQLSERVSLDLIVENAFDAAVEIGETAGGIESFAPPRRFALGLSLR